MAAVAIVTNVAPRALTPPPRTACLLVLEQTFTTVDNGKGTSMGKSIGRVCGLLAALVLAALGVIGAVPVVPKAVWIGLAVAAFVFTIGEFIWDSRRTNGHAPRRRLKQTQNGRDNSVNFQAGGNIRDVRVTGPAKDDPK